MVDMAHGLKETKQVPPQVLFTGLRVPENKKGQNPKAPFSKNATYNKARRDSVAEKSLPLLEVSSFLQPKQNNKERMNGGGLQIPC